MDASSSEASPYGEEDLFFLCMWSIIDKVTARALLFVLKEASDDKHSDESFLEYYKRKNISKNKLKNRNMSQDQIEMLKSETDGKKFDVPLLCACLRNGNYGLADSGNKDLWEEGDTTIESCITSLKNLRNSFVHCGNVTDHQMLIDETDKIKTLLIKFLNFAKEKYSIQEIFVVDEIQVMNKEMLKYTYANLVPESFNKYKKLSVFPELCSIVNKEGVEAEEKRYNEDFNNVRTTNHVFDVSLSIEKIFTGVKLLLELVHGKRRSEKDSSFEEVLQGENHLEGEEVIVIHGPAGAGKTTLTKKMLKDWVAKTSQMEHLVNYKHILKVECRNSTNNSFNSLLNYVMPEVAKKFPSLDRLKYVICSQKVLVIIDGIDELNASSALLVDEILQISKMPGFNVRVLATTRPEKLRFIERSVKSLGMEVKIIKLVGIPMEKRLNFASNYHDALVEKYGKREDKQRLLKYLKRTENRLSNIWELPYNLVLITILWISDDTISDRIHTESELYQEMLKLYKRKLEERLGHHGHVDPSRMNWIINSFIFCMSKEAISGLLDDHIDLPLDAYERLERVSRNSSIPPDELSGAFLKRRQSLTITYSFPHKGLQEFLAAHYICLKITEKYEGPDASKIVKDIENSLSQSSVPVSLKTIFCMFCEEQLNKRYSSSSFDVKKTREQVERVLDITLTPENIHKTVIDGFDKGVKKMTSGKKGKTNVQEYGVIRSILEEIHDGPIANISKHHNTLLQLCGMFCLEKNAIEKNIKREALDLLSKCGVQGRDNWLKALCNMKCDEFVAEYLIENEQLLLSPVEITDDNIVAYIALMQAMKPASNLLDVVVDLKLRDELPDEMDRLINAVGKFQLRVRSVLVTDKNMAGYKSALQNLKQSLISGRKVYLYLELEEELTHIAEFYHNLKQDAYEITQVILSHPYKQSTHLESSEADVISKIFEMCEVTKYQGPMIKNISEIPTSVKELSLSFPDSASFQFLQRSLQLPIDIAIDLCLSISFDRVDDLSPLAFVTRNNMFLVDVTDQDVTKACDILKHLQPLDSNERFHCISFPRASLSVNGIKDLIEKSKDSGVRMTNLILPSRGAKDKDASRLVQIAKTALGTTHGITWRDEANIWDGIKRDS